MKKLSSAFLFLSLFIPFLKVANANEYKFLKSEDSTFNGSPSVEIYGINADGSTTFLNRWQSSSTGIVDFSTNIKNSIVDEYTGKIYVDTLVNVNPPANDYTVTLEYDLVNNNFKELENISNNSTQMILYPKGITQMITEKTDGSIHIGENSAVFKEENGREKFWAQDANGKSIPIDITNGSKLLINGRDVEQSINNVGALSAALTGLPTVPTDTTFACGLGSGTHGGDLAFSGGCASKVNEKLSINYAASMTMPGQDYAGDFEDTFSARAGFVWKLGKSVQPNLMGMKAKEKMEVKINALEEKNTNLENTVSTLMAKLERLEKIALIESKSKDLAAIKLP